jgi:hypothetical protein
VLGLINLASVEPVRKALRDGKGFQHVAWLMQCLTPNTQAPQVMLEVRAPSAVAVGMLLASGCLYPRNPNRPGGLCRAVRVPAAQHDAAEHQAQGGGGVQSGG